MSDISVIVPVYNIDTYLKRCIESLLAQNYFTFEEENGNEFNIPETNPNLVLSPKVKIWSKDMDSFNLSKKKPWIICIFVYHIDFSLI